MVFKLTHSVAVKIGCSQLFTMVTHAIALKQSLSFGGGYQENGISAWQSLSTFCHRALVGTRFPRVV